MRAGWVIAWLLLGGLLGAAAYKRPETVAISINGDVDGAVILDDGRRCDWSGDSLLSSGIGNAEFEVAADGDTATTGPAPQVDVTIVLIEPAFKQCIVHVRSRMRQDVQVDVARHLRAHEVCADDGIADLGRDSTRRWLVSWDHCDSCCVKVQEIENRPFSRGKLTHPK